jgi:hypothetical protein
VGILFGFVVIFCTDAVFLPAGGAGGGSCHNDFDDEEASEPVYLSYKLSNPNTTKMEMEEENQRSFPAFFGEQSSCVSIRMCQLRSYPISDIITSVKLHCHTLFLMIGFF